MESENVYPRLVEVELDSMDDGQAKMVTETETKMKDFDEILDIVGGEGKYQKKILYGILCLFMILMPMFCLNKIFMLSIPAHNCHVDGKPQEMDLETWKNMTIPKEKGPDGQLRFSQCKMLTPDGGNVSCQKWDYDQTDYDSTLPSDFNWVCDKANYATNVFTAAFTGNVFGSIVFGRAADRFGRKPVLYLTLCLYLLLQMSALFIPQYFYLFLAIHFISESAFPFLFMTPLMLAAEISGKDYRGWIYSVSWMVWVIGHCTLSLIAWGLRSWFLIGLWTIIPSTVLFLFYPILPESPRWLIGIGRLKEAESIIQTIARTNNRSVDMAKVHQNLLVMAAKEMESEKTSFVGTLNIFSKKRLALNTIMLCIASSMNRLLFDGLTINTTSMVGNEFLNFLLLGLIELPASWLAGILVDRAGRRWTQVGFFGLCVVAFIVASITVFYPDLSSVVLAAVITAKFGSAVTTLVVTLQSTELFPTQLRSTGNGVVNFVSSIIGIGGPYIIFLGYYNAAGPYILLGILCVIGVISAAYLPETLNSNLPESIEEAEDFGRNEKFWSFLPKGNKSDKNQKALKG